MTACQKDPGACMGQRVWDMMTCHIHCISGMTTHGRGWRPQQQSGHARLEATSSCCPRQAGFLVHCLPLLRKECAGLHIRRGQLIPPTHTVEDLERCAHRG